MDEADHADGAIEANLAAALARSRTSVGPLPIGSCLFCFKPLGRGMRWCDADCRTDWEDEQAALRHPRNRAVND